MTSISRNGLSVKQWQKIKPFLPPEKRKGKGRPSKSHLMVLNAIFWILRTGAPWRDIPEKYGSWSTIYSRFYRWAKQELWQQIMQALQELANSENRINWEIHHVDGSIVRAHQHSAGARKTYKGEPRTQDDLALGKSKGGFSTKIHIRVDGNGRPISFCITPGQVNEIRIFQPLMEMCSIKKNSKGRPNKNSKALAADKAYSSNNSREYLKKKNIKVVIPTRTNEKRYDNFDKELYKQRNQVERTINHLKNYRKIATRYDKTSTSFLAFLTIASISFWL